MRAAHVSVSLWEDTPLCSRPYISSTSGRPVAALDVGESEVAVFGSPSALRRLALEAVRAAEDAEELDCPLPAVESEFAAR